ncbi:DNA-binding response regulator [Bacillus sp. FJAT-27264]|uniref:response regulator transcription factor n=1 Tax=Paenibacillus sp. (strain DSM 101736 / FJAT-27264) TaxID=1850362 RepID=UPI000807AB74|nr:response regulator transcription factor [Bacillus sp. FJAT-27264]OBZ14436.1 DNA-binding response regulator [Bacillus sp. FJAT-27264]
MSKIVVVDDDLFILQLLSEYLRKETYDVTSFSSGHKLVEHVRANTPDCLILDIMMPGINGLSLLTELRSFTEMPIIMISARGEENDRIQGLELGCSDFLSKPFNPRELVGRVKAMLRLAKSGGSGGIAAAEEASVHENSESIYKFGNVEIQPEFRKITVGNISLSLTSREFELLMFLAMHIERPFEREHLIQQVWKYDFFGDVRVVDDLVKRIRKKLGELDSLLQIDTVWGFGYKAIVRKV